MSPLLKAVCWNISPAAPTQTLPNPGHMTSPAVEDLTAGSSQTCTSPVSRPLLSFNMVAEKELAAIRKDYTNPAGRKCIVSDYNRIKK